MALNSIETDPAPPHAEADREVIRSWDAAGIQLEEDGEGRALIISYATGKPVTYGEITWDEDLQDHRVDWNDAGCRAYTMAGRDHWDDSFYDVMDQWRARRDR
jgi:hypothetical protein